MRKVPLALIVCTSILAPPGVGAASEHPQPAPTAVTALSGEAVEGGTAVSGSAEFGGQAPVPVSEDPPGDGPGMVPVGDLGGVDQAGVDLLGASLSVPDPAVPDLLVQWQVSNLPTGGLPEGTRTTMAFEVEDQVFQVRAKLSSAAGDTTPDDPQGHVERIGEAFQLLGDCTESVGGTEVSHCHHLLWLEGAFDTATGIVSARVPLGSAAAPAIAPGADLRRNDAPNDELSKVLAGYHAGASASSALNDVAEFGPPGQDGFAFPVPQKEIMLGIAPRGTDPGAVEFSTPASLAADDTFTGFISTGGMAPGSFDVFARACFADNCGIRSLEGVEVVGDTAVAVLALPDGPDEPDRSFAFWRGGVVGNRVEHSLPSGNQGFPSCSNSPCFEYALRVETPGAVRLRIGIDARTRNDNYVTQVTAPDGRDFSQTNPNSFNQEIFIEDPPVGTYDILVRPYSAANTAFSMRARLEDALPSRVPDAEGLLLPDLRPTPPYEVGFMAPLNPANGIFPPDDVNPPASAAGVAPASCAADETVDDEVARCLRFSFGLANAGQGNFDIRWDGSSNTGPMTQCVQRADGDPMARPAGEFEFHNTHFHTHYKDIVLLHLFRVTDPETGTMEPAGDGRKIGYSPADQGFADWFRFDQASPGTSGNAGNCAPGTGNRLGMSVGWGDVYRYQRPGNFVNFGLNPDGRYVVRLTVDPLDNVLEASESNNVSYTYLQVAGDDIQVLEQGRGESPWDPDKDVRTPRYRGGVPW
jgi:hypothetical protein